MRLEEVVRTNARMGTVDDGDRPAHALAEREHDRRSPVICAAAAILARGTTELREAHDANAAAHRAKIFKEAREVRRD